MKTELEPEKIYCMVYDYTGDTNNVYVRVSKVHEVGENVYVKIQKPVVNKGLLQYQHKDLCDTGWDYLGETSFGTRKEI